MPRHTYAVIADGRMVVAASKIAVARKHAKGVAGRRIIKVGSRIGEPVTPFELRDMRGGRYTIHGTEVQ